MSEISIKDIINWCDRMSLEGHQITIEWSGGGDDGWVELKVDSLECHEPISEKLKDMLNSQIGYAWWIGDSSASGEAIYFPELRVFKGIHTLIYSDNEVMIECNIEIRLPKTLGFNRITIDTFEEGNVNLTFISSDKDCLFLSAVSKELTNYFQKLFRDMLIKYMGGESFLQITGTWCISRDDFEDDGKDLVCFPEELFAKPVDIELRIPNTLCFKEILIKATEERKLHVIFMSDDDHTINLPEISNRLEDTLLNILKDPLEKEFDGGVYDTYFFLIELSISRSEFVEVGDDIVFTKDQILPTITFIDKEKIELDLVKLFGEENNS